MEATIKTTKKVFEALLFIMGVLFAVWWLFAPVLGPIGGHDVKSAVWVITGLFTVAVYGGLAGGIAARKIVFLVKRWDTASAVPPFIMVAIAVPITVVSITRFIRLVDHTTVLTVILLTALAFLAGVIYPIPSQTYSKR